MKKPAHWRAEVGGQVTYTRECLAIEVDQGLKGEHVVATMERLMFLRGQPPEKIRVDNGPEFVSRVLDHWA